MAAAKTTTKKTTPAAKAKAKPAAKAKPKRAAAKPRRAKPKEKAPADYLQDALDDLEKARAKAGKEVSASIDKARDRISDARADIDDQRLDQVKEWREQAGNAADEALRELGRWAIRAQRSPDALNDLSKEITKRRAQVKKG